MYKNPFSDKRMFFQEDLCLITLLKGVCLKYMKSPLQAEECFKTIIEQHGKLKKDTYLVPYSSYELALLMKDDGNLSEALDLLEKTK